MFSLVGTDEINLRSLSQAEPQQGYKNNFFGEGNVNTAFEAFTSQHQCNIYCKWFQLERLTAVDVDENKDLAAWPEV